jgi:hypothetical protein
VAEITLTRINPFKTSGGTSSATTLGGDVKSVLTGHGTPVQTSKTSKGLPLGILFVGAVVFIGLADTKAAPVVATFLAGVAVYQAGKILKGKA